MHNPIQGFIKFKIDNMIEKTISHYKILKKLGEGGMGVVYKAEDLDLKREVAIKFLPHYISVDEAQRKRFEIEAQAAASLNHTNIATIYSIEKISTSDSRKLSDLSEIRLHGINLSTNGLWFLQRKRIRQYSTTNR